jgi:TDG/mug DNA glycosylase family protein
MRRPSRHRPALSAVWKPTPKDLASAADKRLSDILAPSLAVVFCGINPGLYSGAVGHHFARPGNRFWPALHQSGWTDRQLSPFEDERLIEYGAGITNIVERATAAAAELSNAELRSGARRLRTKVARFRPRAVAVLGVTAYAAAMGVKSPKLGPQPALLEGSQLWVLPNPSGLNAHYRPADFARLFRELRENIPTC